jgi:hypothetical protein
MPLTFAHPAIVLPFLYLPKRYVSVTGLIVGSVTPDLEKLARLQAGLSADSTYSHTGAGVFWLDLPLALLLAYVFHVIVRDPLRRNLPAFLRQRVEGYQPINWPHHFKERYGVIILSMLLGIGTHLLWDSFTNKNGYFVQQISFLTDYTRVFKKAIPHFVLAHQFSSAAGGLLGLVALIRLPTQAGTPNPATAKYWFSLAFITGLLLIIRLLLGWQPPYVAVDMALNATTAGLESLIITSYLFRKP